MNIKINDTLYPASIRTVPTDHAWGHRQCKSITLEMDSAAAAALFVNDLNWATVQTVTERAVRVDEVGKPVLDENGAIIYDTEERTLETDYSDYCVAGTITDNRDGTVTVKMGKPTEAELLAVIMGGKNV